MEDNNSEQMRPVDLMWDGVPLENAGQVMKAAIAAVDENRVVQFAAVYAAVTPHCKSNLEMGFCQWGVDERIIDAYFKY